MPTQGIILAAVAAATPPSMCTFPVSEIIEAMGVSLGQVRATNPRHIIFLPRLVEQSGDTPIILRKVFVNISGRWEPISVDPDGAIHLDFKDPRLTAATKLGVAPDCGRGLGLGVALGLPLPVIRDVRVRGQDVLNARAEYERFRRNLPLFKRAFTPRLRSVQISIIVVSQYPVRSEIKIKGIPGYLVVLCHWLICTLKATLYVRAQSVSLD